MIIKEDIYLKEDEQMPPRGAIWTEGGVWFQAQGRLRVRVDKKDWIVGFAVGEGAGEQINRSYWKKPEFHNPPDILHRLHSKRNSKKARKTDKLI